MGKDIITGLRGGLTERKDLKDDPSKTISIGKVTTDASFKINGWLGELIGVGDIDLTDSVRFTVPYLLQFNFNTSGFTSEISKFSNGVATSIFFDNEGSGQTNTLTLSPGEYVLSVSDFNYEPVAYAVSASFTKFQPKDTLTGFRDGVSTSGDDRG